MLPPLLGKETVKILTPVMVDDRGTLVPDWSQPPSVVTSYGWSVQPVSTSERLGERQQTSIKLRAWGNPGDEIPAHCAIEWRGKRYALDGASKHWHDPLGNLSHRVVDLIRWEG